jgi:IclR family transcriptional regulator, KDG regulon repressor
MDTGQGLLSTVGAALDVLRFLSTRGGDVRVTEVADHFGMGKATAYRLLATLKSRGFVEQNKETSKYRVGCTAFEVGNAYVRQLELLHVADQIMSELVKQCNEKTNLAVLDRTEGEIVYIKFLDYERAVRVVTHIGSRAPLSTTALGKAVLSQMRWEEATDLIKIKGMQAATKKSITDLDVFRKELQTAKQTGYAVDDEELHEEVRCVAAAVLDHTGDPIAALSISGSIHHVPAERIPELGKMVVPAALAISRMLGYRGS